MEAPKHFDPNRERWEDWLQQYSWYETAMEMKKKEPEVQVASFMTIIGSDAQKIYRTFVLSPEETKKVEEIKKCFTNYFLPKKNYTMERYNFNKLQQSMVETITEFITRLRLQASKCKFESLEDELIKDRVVVGIHDDHTREKLLSDPDLDLDKAIQICMAAERTNKEIKVMQQRSDQEVSVIKKNFRPKKNVTMEEVPKLIDNCKKCGGTHPIRRCPAYGKICKKCRKANHFAKCCRSNFRYKNKINTLEEEGTEKDEFSLQINSLSEFTSEPMEKIQINNTEPFKIKLDTGAQCNVLPWNIFKKINSKLNRSSVKSLKSFSGHRIKVEGEIIASCIINNIKADIKFIVTKTGTTPILGSESCFMLGLLKRINKIKPVEQEIHQLFNGDGCLKNFEYRAEFTKGDHKLEIKPPRRIPLKIKDEVKKQLDLMEKSKVIKRMEEPTPVSSHMVVVKQGGKYRICIDPSDLNKILLRRHYPLRTIEDIASNIKNSKYFTKLDFLKGFWQLKVAAETQPYMTFSTPWGRYAFLRVPFGIKTAPEIFQNTISKIVENIPGVENSMDDILIHAEDIQTLRERTKIVMTTLQEAGARLNKDKCEFEKTKIKFLGHIFTSDGIKTDEEKVKAIDNIKSPSNKKELQRLLGMYYDPNKDVVLSVDASQHAIGAVLLQEDRPIAYASSALNDAQRHFPQIEKEALAIKFGCKKFHTYIYGKSLLIETDHRPLESIYKKPMDKMPPRLQKIFMEINQYGTNIKYKSGKELLIADLLSRDCKSYEILEENPIEILLITAFDNVGTKKRLRKPTEIQKWDLQISMTDKAKLKTAFITPDDTGQFERMIFGLANAPAEFQRLMHTVLGPLLNKKAFCYLDDVIIPAKDWREMIERLREVLERIRSAKLTLKPSKCEFGRREVEFLGYVISTGGLKPGPRKIKAIEEFPEPKNVHDIRRFLGLTNFFRRFVKDFARKAEPLSRLTKKGSQFEWKEEQRRSFGGLRKDLVEYPVLAHYNPELKTEVHCDASAEGLAGMVLQMDEDGKWRLVYCVSKKTTEAEKMYHSSKLELMAIVWTLDRLRQFLVGIKFTVVTDCQALVYMNAKKTTNPQIA
ncbi:K02A2.6-like [Cordylochernes scorpioides]|uniref:RNA-directed DNA polymerase n=1 Tax=Cordylochernes scorpioides TaxID=51811 RepID=A0ABY6L1X6_9ARAC|nr:K02A2.6-like [Cordylochernes scorpioides]